MAVDLADLERRGQAKERARLAAAALKTAGPFLDEEADRLLEAAEAAWQAGQLCGDTALGYCAGVLAVRRVRRALLTAADPGRSRVETGP